MDETVLFPLSSFMTTLLLQLLFVSTVKLKAIACITKPDKIDQATFPEVASWQPLQPQPYTPSLTSQSHLKKCNSQLCINRHRQIWPTQTKHRYKHSISPVTPRISFIIRDCKIRGHSENNCRKIKVCEYCHRRGHLTSECQRKRHEERQERLFQCTTASVMLSWWKEYKSTWQPTVHITYIFPCKPAASQHQQFRHPINRQLSARSLVLCFATTEEWSICASSPLILEASKRTWETTRSYTIPNLIS